MTSEILPPSKVTLKEAGLGLYYIFLGEHTSINNSDTVLSCLREAGGFPSILFFYAEIFPSQEKGQWSQRQGYCIPSFAG